MGAPFQSPAMSLAQFHRALGAHIRRAGVRQVKEIMLARGWRVAADVPAAQRYSCLAALTKYMFVEESGP